jgi:hypothetical protein
MVFLYLTVPIQKWTYLKGALVASPLVSKLEVFFTVLLEGLKELQEIL